MFEFESHWPEEDLALRIAEIVSGLTTSSFRPYKKENGSWTLDTGNNWFLHELSERHWRLQYRYGLAEKLREALQTICTWAVGPPQRD